MVCSKFRGGNRHNLANEKAVPEIGIYDNLPQQRHDPQKQTRGEFLIITHKKQFLKLLPFDHELNHGFEIFYCIFARLLNILLKLILYISDASHKSIIYSFNLDHRNKA